MLKPKVPLLLLIGMLLFEMACAVSGMGQERSTLFPGFVVPTGTSLPPYAIPTAYFSAPRERATDLACRTAIQLFFLYRKDSGAFDQGLYRELFVPSSQYLADTVQPSREAFTLLKLEPASQWWQENFSATPIPGTFLPESPNEYFYHVEYTIHDQSAATSVTGLDGMTMTMIVDGPSSCKIKKYGKG